MVPKMIWLNIGQLNFWALQWKETKACISQNVDFIKYQDNVESFCKITLKLVAFTGVTNAHVPSPQPTVCRSPTCNLMTATGSNQA